jgi:hypothetical protein
MEPANGTALHLLDERGRAIWRTVVNNEYIEGRIQPKYMCQDLLDVLLLVESGDDDQSFTQGRGS